MGTWAIPYEYMESAEEFRTRMSEPWIAKVKFDPGIEAWVGDAEGLNQLFGDDYLFDLIANEAERRKTDFDVRPFVAKAFAKMFEECLVLGEDIVDSNLEATNVCRAAVGLDPVAL